MSETREWDEPARERLEITGDPEAIRQVLLGLGGLISENEIELQVSKAEPVQRHEPVSAIDAAVMIAQPDLEDRMAATQPEYAFKSEFTTNIYDFNRHVTVPIVTKKTVEEFARGREYTKGTGTRLVGALTKHIRSDPNTPLAAIEAVQHATGPGAHPDEVLGLCVSHMPYLYGLYGQNAPGKVNLGQSLRTLFDEFMRELVVEDRPTT